MNYPGSLNKIAQLSSVLYLLSYCAVNISCLCLDLSSAPNFRPNFRYFHWTTSLVGLFGCGVMIFLIRSDWLTVDWPKHWPQVHWLSSPTFASISVAFCICIMMLLYFFSPVKKLQNWGHIGTLSFWLLSFFWGNNRLFARPSSDFPSSEKIFAAVGREEGTCQVLEATNASVGGQSQVILFLDPLCQ